MDWHQAALLAAGVIGGAVAIIHGVVMQKMMIEPFEKVFVGDPRMRTPARRLVPVLLHFSTFG